MFLANEYRKKNKEIKRETGKIESKYIWQMQMGMLVCKKKWCDYIAYNPNFREPLFVHRIFPDLEKYKKLEIGFETGKKLIKEEIKRWSYHYGNSNATNGRNLLPSF